MIFVQITRIARKLLSQFLSLAVGKFHNFFRKSNFSSWHPLFPRTRTTKSILQSNYHLVVGVSLDPPKSNCCYGCSKHILCRNGLPRRFVCWLRAHSSLHRFRGCWGWVQAMELTTMRPHAILFAKLSREEIYGLW